MPHEFAVAGSAPLLQSESTLIEQPLYPSVRDAPGPAITAAGRGEGGSNCFPSRPAVPFLPFVYRGDALPERSLELEV